MPTRKPSPPRNADDPAQSRRFIEAGRELEAEEPAADADAILRKLASAERTPSAADRTLEKIIRLRSSRKTAERL